jgi:hypothetical protein
MGLFCGKTPFSGSEPAEADTAVGTSARARLPCRHVRHPIRNAAALAKPFHSASRRRLSQQRPELVNRQAGIADDLAQ